MRLNAQETLKHELTHHLLDSVMRQAPLWLSEGLATYMEGLEVDTARNVLILGEPSVTRMHELANGQWTSRVAEWSKRDVDAVAFRDLPSDALAKELTARFNVRSMPYSFSEIPLIPPLAKRAVTRKLSTAEMHAQLAELELSSSSFRSRDRAEHEARAALALEPLNLKAPSLPRSPNPIVAPTP